MFSRLIMPRSEKGGRPKSKNESDCFYIDHISSMFSMMLLFNSSDAFHCISVVCWLFSFRFMQFPFRTLCGTSKQHQSFGRPKHSSVRGYFYHFRFSTGKSQKRIFEFELLSLPFVVTLLVLKAFITTGGTSVH